MRNRGISLLGLYGLEEALPQSIQHRTPYPEVEPPGEEGRDQLLLLRSNQAGKAHRSGNARILQCLPIAPY
jgi:hypothetical protein